jgi:hypothetical protein
MGGSEMHKNLPSYDELGRAYQLVTFYHSFARVRLSLFENKKEQKNAQIRDSPCPSDKRYLHSGVCILYVTNILGFIGLFLVFSDINNPLVVKH